MLCIDDKEPTLVMRTERGIFGTITPDLDIILIFERISKRIYLRKRTLEPIISQNNVEIRQM